MAAEAEGEGVGHRREERRERGEERRTSTHVAVVVSAAFDVWPRRRQCAPVCVDSSVMYKSLR